MLPVSSDVLLMGGQNLKKKSPGQKKNSWNQINQLHDFFDQIPFFAIQNFKTAKNAISWEFFFDLFDFTRFFAWNFLNFLARYAIY